MPNLLESLKSALSTQDAAKALHIASEIVQQYDEGLIKELPCKVGDTVYKTVKLISGETIIAEGKVIEHAINRSGQEFYFKQEIRCDHDIWCESGCFGKTVFLTRAEAEKALKEREI